MTSEHLIIKHIRSDSVAGEQYVDAAAVDSSERLLRGWGRYESPVIPHCCAKPFQTIALIESGAANKYNLDDQEIALATSSQGGEETHRDLGKKWLAKLGLPESAIKSGAAPPYSLEARKELILSNSQPTIFHYGSVGRHLSLLSICMAKGFPIENYRDPSHPVQRYVWRVIAPFFGLDPEKLEPTIVELDETPIPTVSLKRLASATVRFCAKATQGESAAATRIQNAMIDYPDIITWRTNYINQLLNIFDGKLFLKTGAYSICIVCHMPSGTGIALKMRDGSDSLKITCALVPILRRLDLLTSAEWQRLAPLAEPALLSNNGARIGSINAGFVPTTALA